MREKNPKHFQRELYVITKSKKTFQVFPLEKKKSIFFPRENKK